jgi:guanylate kinase
MEKGRIFVFSSPSGGGKTTVLSRLCQKHPEFVYSISATTRPPRQGEVHGRDYFFYSTEEFEKLIDEKGLVEWAQVHNNYYGTPRFFIDRNRREGKIILLDLDVQGKMQLDKIYSDSLGIFIEPPSFDELKRRLEKRGTDDKKTIALRLKNAEKEIRTAHHTANYTYYVINDVLEDTVHKIERIIDLNTRDES